MKKKAFTLIEILLVVFLLSMIVVSMRNVFLMKNKDLIKSQTCVNYVY
ncbi:MAG: prepilin-type N-terminal cleavage/methylation domain-containing protein [Patescibacteria group bacterium]